MNHDDSVGFGLLGRYSHRHNRRWRFVNLLTPVGPTKRRCGVFIAIYPELSLYFVCQRWQASYVNLDEVDNGISESPVDLESHHPGHSTVAFQTTKPRPRLLLTI